MPRAAASARIARVGILDRRGHGESCVGVGDGGPGLTRAGVRIDKRELDVEHALRATAAASLRDLERSLKRLDRTGIVACIEARVAEVLEEERQLRMLRAEQLPRRGDDGRQLVETIAHPANFRHAGGDQDSCRHQRQGRAITVGLLHQGQTALRRIEAPFGACGAQHRGEVEPRVGGLELAELGCVCGDDAHRFTRRRDGAVDVGLVEPQAAEYLQRSRKRVIQPEPAGGGDGAVEYGRGFVVAAQIIERTAGDDCCRDRERMVCAEPVTAESQRPRRRRRGVFRAALTSQAVSDRGQDLHRHVGAIAELAVDPIGCLPEQVGGRRAGAGAFEDRQREALDLLGARRFELGPRRRKPRCARLPYRRAGAGDDGQQDQPACSHPPRRSASRARAASTTIERMATEA